MTLLQSGILYCRFCDSLHLRFGYCWLLCSSVNHFTNLQCEQQKACMLILFGGWQLILSALQSVSGIAVDLCCIMCPKTGFCFWQDKSTEQNPIPSQNAGFVSVYSILHWSTWSHRGFPPGLYRTFVSYLLVCIFCVSVLPLRFCIVSFVGFSSFQYRAKRFAGKNVFEMTYFVSSGTLNLAPSIHLLQLRIVGLVIYSYSSE